MSDAPPVPPPPSPSSLLPPLTRLRLEASGKAVERAQGSGWAAANPLGPHARSETEAAADFEGKRVHRVMFRVSERVS